MGIFGNIKKRFISESDKINQSHLRNFYIIAITGDKVSDEDYRFIENLGMELQLSKTLIYEVFNSGATIKTYKPTHGHVLNKNIFDYIKFAKRNGQITQKERTACKMILLELTSIRESKALPILDEIIKEVEQEDSIVALTHDRIGRIINHDYAVQLGIQMD